MRDEGGLRLAVAPTFRDWYDERRVLMSRRMDEVERGAAAGELIDVAITVAS